jgi:glycosyltransferase involved in cell wall biosynthesis
MTILGAPARQVVIISKVKRNPYVELLCQGLNQPGLGLVARIEDQLSVGWLWSQRRQIDVLHVQWLELLFSYPSLGRSLKRWLSVMMALALARLQGICLVYTLHNVWQHEGQRKTLTALGNRVMFALAQAVHVHDPETAAALAQRWGRRRGVHVIPHGNYVAAYANTVSQAEARAYLGLADRPFIYLFLGRVRPYKGIEELLAAFRALGGDCALVIAGEAQEPSYLSAVRAKAQGDPRVHLHLEYVPDDQVQWYLNACDVCVLPYRHVTTSGAALLAFSFGVPIIAPRIGCFQELVGANERGLLYDANDPDGLLTGLRAARQLQLPALRQACRRYINDLDWPSIARRHAAMYTSYRQVS